MAATGEEGVQSLSDLRTELLREGGVMVWLSPSTPNGAPEGKAESSGRKQSRGKPR